MRHPFTLTMGANRSKAPTLDKPGRFRPGTRLEFDRAWIWPRIRHRSIIGAAALVGCTLSGVALSCGNGNEIHFGEKYHSGKHIHLLVRSER
jgi:hypothetical protein